MGWLREPGSASNRWAPPPARPDSAEPELAHGRRDSILIPMSPAQMRTLSLGDISWGGIRPEALLERGEILCFRPGTLPLQPEADLAFLRDELGPALENVRYHPEGDSLTGLAGPALERTRAILRAHHGAVREFLRRICPRYAQRWRAGEVTFRPLEEEGRGSASGLGPGDALASGATHGGRILRFFTNVNPTRARVWRSAGTFAELFAEFGGQAGLAALGEGGLRERLPDRLRTGLVGLARRVGLAARDTSPYDRALERLHAALARDPAFQDRGVEFEFPPFTSWTALTDTVSHSAVRGQHALVCTWIVPLASCVAPELSPYAVMERGLPHTPARAGAGGTGGGDASETTGMPGSRAR